MEEAIQQLLTNDSIQIIDSAVDALSTMGSDSSSSEQVLSACQSFLKDRAGVGNSKTRRKIVRLVDRLQASLVEELEESVQLQQTPLKEDYPAALRSCSSSEEIESEVVKISDLLFNTIPRAQLENIIVALESVVDSSELSLNSKMKRRIKRLVATIQESMQASATASVRNNYDLHTKEVTKVSVPETVRLLRMASRVRDVENALNSMDISTLAADMEGNSSLRRDVESLRVEMTAKLEQSPNLTNKKLRHRMKKSVFVLDTILNGERPAKTDKKPPHDQTTLLLKAAPIVTPVVAACDLPALQSALAAAGGDGDIVQALKSVPARAEDLMGYFGHDLEMAAAVKTAIDGACEKCEGSIGAKGKRKISRITAALESILPRTAPAGKKRPLVDEVTDSPAVSHSAKDTGDKRVKKRSMEEAVGGSSVEGGEGDDGGDERASSKKRAKKEKEAADKKAAEASQAEEEVNRKANLFLAAAVAKLRDSKSSADVEAALVGVGGEGGVVGNFANRRALKRVLQQLMADKTGGGDEERKSVNLTSNARRKVRRVLEGLEVAAATRSDLYGWKVVTQEEEKKGDGGGGSGDSEDEGNSNDKDEGSQSDKDEGSGDSSDEEKDVENQGKSSSSDKKVAKHRLFFGQLSFSTTEADVKEYIKQSDIACEVEVRVLTDKDTGKSRGSAFVDILGGKRSVKKILNLHHTMLNGRRINVERTAKRPRVTGADQAHSLATREDRMQQKIAHSETIDRLLTKYAGTGVAEKGGAVARNDFLMNRLYALSVAEATKVLNECRDRLGGADGDGGQSSRPEEVFREVLTRYDDGGHAVDQAIRDVSIRSRAQMVVGGSDSFRNVHSISNRR